LVDETLVSELESAVADTGALLVRLQKYRRGQGPEGDALAREALALGDAARRLHRRRALDAPAARRLLADAHALAVRLHALLAAVRDAPDYRAAVAAHARGDHVALSSALPAIFAGIEPSSATGDLFVPIAWLRRGRLRPVPDVVSDVVAARTEGLAAEGDDLSAGADADLPAVTLLADPPPGEPVVLRVPPRTIAAPLNRLLETGELLVHAARLPVPAASVRLADRLELDDEVLRVEISPAEYTAHRDALAAALAAAGVPVERV
jgi:hypothetical protein